MGLKCNFSKSIRVFGITKYKNSKNLNLLKKQEIFPLYVTQRMRVLDLESLSGGEKVSVALSLRLGMANLLGASNLNLMILDEPTTHLDAERKKSLVGVLSQLSNISNSETPMQFINNHT